MRGRDALQGEKDRSQPGVSLKPAGGRASSYRTALALIGVLAFAPAVAQTAPEKAAAIASYPTGDSCLFCHRNEIGATWLINSHAWTIRAAGEPPQAGALPADATHVVGKDHYRPLQQSGYGKLALHSLGGQVWQDNVFEKQCVGCHATAVNPETGEFSSVALDCYSCHGNVPEDHATRKGTALLSKTRKAAATEVVSICGSCHLRGGRSKTTGRPYPYAYVAGDDLFQDFKVDLQLDKKASIDASDTHIYVKTRAVIAGGSDKTCTECHRIHAAPEPSKGGRRFSEVCHY